MIGQTMINVKASGARTRVSTFAAGVFLLVLVVGLGDVVAVIPMAALVAVMVMVAVGTFDWHSVRPSTLRPRPPRRHARRPLRALAAGRGVRAPTEVGAPRGAGPEVRARAAGPGRSARCRPAPPALRRVRIVP